MLRDGGGGPGIFDGPGLLEGLVIFEGGPGGQAMLMLCLAGGNCCALLENCI